MKRVFLSLISLVWLVCAVPIIPAPAMADSVTEFETACTPNHAEFNTFGINSEGGSYQRDDGKPLNDSGDPDAYPGVFTHIFSCKVVGHYVRINFFSVVSQHMCGAMPRGQISVWVDGVKVVDNESWGDYEACMTHVSGGHGTAHTLTKVIFNKMMHLTVCHNDIKWDPKSQDETATGPVCKINDLSKLKPDTASIYYGEVKLTPPSLVLADDHAAFCKGATDQLNSPHPDQGILTPFWEAVPQPQTDEQKDKGFEQTFTLDIDNDGVTDTLTYKGLGKDFLNGYDHTFAWLSSKTQKTFDVRSSWPESLNMNWLNVDDPRSFHFMKIAGRIYAYQENDDLQGMDEGSDAEIGAGDAEGKITTHSIVELHNDGTITEVCSWKPRQRPEEYL